MLLIKTITCRWKDSGLFLKVSKYFLNKTMIKLSSMCVSAVEGIKLASIQGCELQRLKLECKSLWKFLGWILIIGIFLEYLMIIKVYSVFFLFYDIYFVFDVLLRFRTKYRIHKTETNDSKGNFIHNYWFVFDLFLSLPYGLMLTLWEGRPALKLIQINDNKLKSMFKLIFDKSFRKSTLHNAREFFREKKILDFYLNGQIRVNNRSSFWRAFGIFSSGYRLLKTAKILDSYSFVLKSSIALAVSMRSISLLHSFRKSQ